jgi:hypothetical protein
LSTEKELENMERTIAAIGEPRVPMSDDLVREVKAVLLDRGYDEALVYAEQRYRAEDVNAGLVRVLVICRRYGLSTKAAAQVLDNLKGMEFGKW